MKRPWAFLLAAAVLAGCRTAQPTTNPFMRTTVAPPATGQGVAVVPTDPSTGFQAMPPAVSPAVPVMPPLATPPPGVAPPVAVPPREKYSPPGGSFQYHQSSVDRSKSDAKRNQTPVRSTAGVSPTAPETVRDDARSSAPSDAVQQAVWLANTPDSPIAASYHEPASQEPREAVSTDARVEPPERLTLPETSGNQIRILGANANDDLQAAKEEGIPPAGDHPVFRVTAGQAERRTGASTFREVKRLPDDRAVSQAARVTSDPETDTTPAQDDGTATPASSSEIRWRQAGSTHYALAPENGS